MRTIIAVELLDGTVPALDPLVPDRVPLGCARFPDNVRGMCKFLDTEGPVVHNSLIK